ncbi:MAG: phosphatase PAP2 family protein [Acidimicrobiales bacterium]|nr:phosphatase PAP2 family protein [Acidimicrobiales bacterium]
MPEQDHRPAFHLHTVEPPHELGPIHRFDEWVDRQFDRVRGREPHDRIMYALTELGDFGLIWLLIGFARGIRSDRDATKALRLAACLGAESVLVNGVIKSLFKRERPVVQGTRPHKLRVPLTTSFPSGHASSAVVAATLLSEESRLWPAYWALALAVASSRIHVRIHHASDVIGGLATGAVVGLVARRLWRLPSR